MTILLIMGIATGVAMIRRMLVYCVGVLKVPVNDNFYGESEDE